nr:MAG: Minor capsid protein from bacteriophage [Bacteriophage sp.]
MAKADSIIDALEKYFIGCELLKDGALRVDYLGEKPVEYTIEVLPCDPVVKRYLGGSTVRQYLFAFGSREFYSQERLQNIQNSAFYERLADWVETRSMSGILPELPDGMEAQQLEVVSSGYLFDGSMTNARYQIQLRLLYFKEA